METNTELDVTCCDIRNDYVRLGVAYTRFARISTLVLVFVERNDFDQGQDTS